MTKYEKKRKKGSPDRDLDKKMKGLSKTVAKQVSIFYKQWFKIAEQNSLRKTES